MDDLSVVERRVLGIVQEHFARGDARLTVREIAGQLGHRTTSRAQESIRSLERRGYIVKSPRNGRIIGMAHKCPTCGQSYPTKGETHDDTAGHTATDPRRRSRPATVGRA